MSDPVMLASALPTGKMPQFPCYASAKLDGIRVYIKDGVVCTRNAKPVRNQWVQTLFGRYEGFDGELIVGPPNSHEAYTRTMSGTSRADGAPDVVLYVFDRFPKQPREPFSARYADLQKTLKKGKDKNVVLLEQVLLHNEKEFLDLEDNLLEQEYEGMMVRGVESPYKFGRATAKEGYLLKVKRFVDDEALILSCYELMHNANEKTLVSAGKAVRSSHKAGMQPLGKLGGFEVTRLHMEDEPTFSVGTGFTDAQRTELWERRDKLPGSFVKFRYFPSGSKERPRFPTFLGFRDPDDMDPKKCR